MTRSSKLPTRPLADFEAPSPTARGAPLQFAGRIVGHVGDEFAADEGKQTA